MKEATRRMARRFIDPKNPGGPAGVIPKLKHTLDVLRPGIFSFWQNDGPVSTQARRTNLKLIAKKIIPGLRDYAKKPGLKDPFQQKPGAVPIGASGKRDMVANPDALAGSA